jgi:hypothetical protein
MKAFAACITILVLAMPAAAISATYEGRIISGECAAPGNSASFEIKDRIVDIDELRMHDFGLISESDLGPAGGGLEYITSCLWSDLNDMHIEDGIIYCALTYGLMILDVRGGLPFETISTLYLSTHYGRGAQLEKHGGYIYFTRTDKVVVIDVSDIHNPFVVGSYPAQGVFIELAYADDVLYLVDEILGYPVMTYYLTILDISDPADPTLLSAYTCPELGEGTFDNNLNYVAVRDGIAFVSANAGFHIIDVSDPANPTALASRNQGQFRNAIVRDNIAYAVKHGSADSVIVFSLSDPANPERIAVHEYSDTIVSLYDMILADSLLITSCDIVNVSDPSAPVFISSYHTQGAGTALGLCGSVLYRAFASFIVMFDISDIEEPHSMEDYYSLPGTVRNVYVRDNLAYVKTGGGLVILDISDIHNPLVISTYTPTYGWCIDVREDIICSGYLVIDISDPAHPIVRAVLELGSLPEVRSVRLKDNLAFVARNTMYEDGLLVFDLTDPSNPVLLSSYVAGLPFLVQAPLAVQDTLAFISTGYQEDERILIINYANPSSPELIGKYYVAGPCKALAVDGNILYVSSLGNLQVVDISDPGNPVLLCLYEFTTSYPDFSANALVPQGDYLYAAAKYRNLVVFDVSDPTSPFHVETFFTPSSGTGDLFLVDDIIFLADTYGLMMVRNPYNAPPARSVSFDIKPGSCPNPLNWKINPNGKAVLPVAVLGSEYLDVHDVDVSSVRLMGDLEPVRYAYEDVAAPPDSAGGDCACTKEGADGHFDLTLKFDKRSVMEKLHAMAEADQYVLTVTGLLVSGERIEGHDCVHPVGREAGGSDAAGPVADGSSEKARPLLDAHSENVTIRGNYPNPFNPATEISFSLPEASRVILDIYNIAGQRVITLVDEYYAAGDHSVAWDGRGAFGQHVASGVYFCRIRTDAANVTKKMLLLK